MLIFDAGCTVRTCQAPAGVWTSSVSHYITLHVLSCCHVLPVMFCLQVMNAGEAVRSVCDAIAEGRTVEVRAPSDGGRNPALATA